MPKALCLISLVASILIVVAFLTDAIFSMLGFDSFALFGGVNLTMDIIYILAGAGMIYMSYATYREQR